MRFSKFAESLFIIVIVKVVVIIITLAVIDNFSRTHSHFKVFTVAVLIKKIKGCCNQMKLLFVQQVLLIRDGTSKEGSFS